MRLASSSTLVALTAALVGVACFPSTNYDKVSGAGGAAGQTSVSNGGSGGLGGSGGSGGVGGVGLGGAGGSGGSMMCDGLGGSGNAGCLPACDDFEDDGLDGWTLSPAVSGVSHSIENGELVVTLEDSIAGNYAWYFGDRGWFARQSACGDFAASVSVEVTNMAGDGPPMFDFNSAGLLVRNPMPLVGAENWVMVSIGRQDNNQLGAETKATLNSMSNQIFFHEVGGGPTTIGDMSLCRVGTDVRLFARPAGGSWAILDTFGSGDVNLDNDVELGVVVNGWANQDVRARIDHMRFWVPASLADCMPPE